LDWAALWRRGQQGWPPSFPLIQFPNASLLVFLVAAVLERVASGRLQDVAWAVARVALAIWAYDEAARGVNWFRRLIGVAVLVAVVIGLSNR
jgi:hypothetical protein